MKCFRKVDQSESDYESRSPSEGRPACPCSSVASPDAHQLAAHVLYVAFYLFQDEMSYTITILPVV